MTDEEMKEVREQLVKMGLVRDSGRREWRPETGTYEIIWEVTEMGRKYAREKGL
jgi:hypothetical protein